MPGTSHWVRAYLLDAKNAEIAQLTIERDYYKQAAYDTRPTGMQAERDAALAEVERLREAIRSALDWLRLG